MVISIKRRIPEYNLPWYWQYGDCRRHRAFPTRKAARAQMRVHQQWVRCGMRCWKCEQGRLPEAFRCPEGGRHFHWGHGGAIPGTGGKGYVPQAG